MANFVESFITGLDAGQKLKAQRTRSEAMALYGTDPDRAINMLASGGDAKGAAEFMDLQDAQETRATRKKAQPLIEAGKIDEAARLWLGKDPKVAEALYGASTRQLEMFGKINEAAGGILKAAQEIRVTGPDGKVDPVATGRARMEFVGKQPQTPMVLKSMGATPEMAAQAPWGDDSWLESQYTATLGAKGAADYVFNKRSDAREASKPIAVPDGDYFMPNQPGGASGAAPANMADWLAAGPRGDGTAPLDGQPPAPPRDGPDFASTTAFVIDKLENSPRPIQDSNGATVQHGINAAAHPEAARDGVSRQEAERIYKTQYWDAIGADRLPAAIRAQAYDAAIVQGPALAKRWAAESGGDPRKMAAFRLAHMERLARDDPAQYGRYLKGWRNRVKRVYELGSSTGADTLSGSGAGDQMTNVADSPPAPEGYTLVRRGPRYVDLPDGRQVDIRTGEKKGSATKASETWRPATADEKRQYGLPERAPAKINQAGDIEVVSGAADMAKAEDTAAKEGSRRELQAGKARSVIATADSALGKLGWGEAGLVGAQASKVPGTKAYDLARDVETIKANLGFQELQAMREASPTGGALGQVAVQELIALQATVANLDIGQSEGQLRGNLNKIKTHYQKWLNTIEQGQAAAGATDRPKNWTQGLPPKQKQALRQFYGTRAAAGTKGNPYVPRSEQEFRAWMKNDRAYPPGTWFLDDDGTPFQKPKR